MNQYKQEKREKILLAARQVLAEKEMHETLMDEIADQAGVAKGTLYLYFKSKEDLFRGLFEDTLSLLLHRVRVVTKEAASGRDKLYGLLECQAKFLEENKDFIAHIMMRQPPPIMSPHKGVFASGLQEILKLTDLAVEQAMREKDMKESDVRQNSMTLFALIRGFFLARLIGLSQKPLTEEVSWIWHVFWIGVGGKEQ